MKAYTVKELQKIHKDTMGAYGMNYTEEFLRYLQRGKKAPWQK